MVLRIILYFSVVQNQTLNHVQGWYIYIHDDLVVLHLQQYGMNSQQLIWLTSMSSRNTYYWHLIVWVVLNNWRYFNHQLVSDFKDRRKYTADNDMTWQWVRSQGAWKFTWISTGIGSYNILEKQEIIHASSELTETDFMSVKHQLVNHQ